MTRYEVRLVLAALAGKVAEIDDLLARLGESVPVANSYPAAGALVRLQYDLNGFAARVAETREELGAHLHLDESEHSEEGLDMVGDGV